MTCSPFVERVVPCGADPNLIWAESTGYRDFLRPGEQPPVWIPVIAELDADLGAVAALRHELRRLEQGWVPDIYPDDAQYCTAFFARRYCNEVLGRRTGAMVRRFEMALPVIPRRPRPRRKPVPLPKGRADRKCGTETMIALIDHGCPFAHLRLRDRSGLGTRILSLWEQDSEPPSSPCPVLGHVPSDIGYGRELGRRDLNALMRKNARGQVVDEGACYRALDGDARRSRLSHGAATVNLMAGAPVLPALPSSPCQPQADKASSCDVVFVQLPSDIVQDSSSAGLARCLLDGLRYIVSAAADAKRIVVNISDGTSRGTHDGDSIIEQAMLELTREVKRAGKELVLVLPAGNTFDEERHAQLGPWRGHQPRSSEHVTLRLPPNNESPSYVVVRLPANSGAVSLRVWLKSRSTSEGDVLRVRAGTADAWPRRAPAVAVVFPPPCSDRAGTALIAFAPTRTTGPWSPAAPHGDWVIELRSEGGLAEPVHLYITRNQVNIGALPRALQPRFIDDEAGCPYDPHRHLRPLEDDPVPPRSPIRRRGSLNGLTTAPVRVGLVVVGGHFWREDVAALYSSEGPAPGGTPARPGPDTSAPTEESRALKGIRASGALSGEVVRLRGTSFASPQVARAIVNKEALSPAYDPRPRARAPTNDPAAGRK